MTTINPIWDEVTLEKILSDATICLEAQWLFENLFQLALVSVE